MRILLIQAVLVIGIGTVTVRFLRSRGARGQALRRLGLIAFAGVAIWSIFFPDLWTGLAKLVGVGRGTDMVLYATVVAFLSFTATTYLRFRELETRYTKLARRIALDEAPRPGMTPPPAEGRAHSPDSA